MRPLTHLLKIAFAVALIMATSTSFAQDKVIKNVRVAVKAGDYNSLTDYFHDVVELKTDKEEGSYSKNQAEFVLKSFFRKYPSSTFNYNHVGSSPGGGKWTIGTYDFGSGSFRVFINYRKNTDGQFYIDTMEFTRE